MGTVQRFEDLKIWQMARALYNKVSPIVARLREKKEFRYAEQMKSSSGSIMDNIAEGFGREGTMEFINSLGYSKGETAELKSQLYRCGDDGYITKDEFDDFCKDADNLSRKIANLISYLNACELKGLKFKDRKPGKK